MKSVYAVSTVEVSGWPYSNYKLKEVESKEWQLGYSPPEFLEGMAQMQGEMLRTAMRD